jgi:chromate reductase
MDVLAIAGSLRSGSYNRALLRAAGELVPPGTRVIEWDNLRDIPPFDEDTEDEPSRSVRTFRAAIAASDAVLVVTPEYNGSIPGQLKNALDWASRPFPDNVLRGKPAAVVGASPSPAGAQRSRAETGAVLDRIGAQVVDGTVGLPQVHEQFTPDGELADTDRRNALRHLLDDLAAEARRDTSVIDIADRGAARANHGLTE